MDEDLSDEDLLNRLDPKLSPIFGVLLPQWQQTGSKIIDISCDII